MSFSVFKCIWETSICLFLSLSVSEFVAFIIAPFKARKLFVCFDRVLSA